MDKKIAIRDFYGAGRHIYEDELGFRDDMKAEARSLVPREVFRYEVELVGLNLGFYYPPTDTFYGIHTECRPVKVKTLPRNRCRSHYIGFQCDCDTHDTDVVIAAYNNPADIWDRLLIDGKSFEEVINHSYIVALN